MSLRVLFAHPYLIPRGGAEAKVFYGIQAIRDLAEITLVTTAWKSFRSADQFYGTRLRNCRHAILGPLFPPLPGGVRLDLVRYSLLAARVRRLSRSFDVLISAANLMDFGRPAIQLVADVLWLGKPPARGGIARRLYSSCCNAVRPPQDIALVATRDLIVSNSQWTEKRLYDSFQLRASRVLTPPVGVDHPPSKPPTREPFRFAYVGRIEPEKRVERIISILRQVRSQHPRITLKIVGPIGSSPYERAIAAMVRENASWISHLGALYGQEKVGLLWSCSYYINACEVEAFGISVAESVKCGCIAFVPNSGGQTEIVADPSLCYDDEADAVAKIDALLHDEARQAQVRAHLAERAKLFTTERFMAEFRQIVLDFARERGVKR